VTTCAPGAKCDPLPLAATEAGIFTPRRALYGAILAGVLLGAGVAMSYMGESLAAVGHVCAWASLGVGMVYGGKAALDALGHKSFDIDVLMVVAAGLAAYLHRPEEGALLLFLFTLSGALEDLAMQRTTREISALHKLMPTEAMVFRDGEWLETSASTLVPGDRVKIRPGERVPADATLLTGETSMDQSAITGESMPRHVKPGDELFAGTINTDDPVEATVLRPVHESSLQRIMDLVTTAREQREPVQRFIDRVNEPYAIGVMVISVIVCLIWWLGLGRSFDKSLYTAITLLIVASPCALVIATPTATLAAIARAARGGVLFKGGQTIDRLARVRSVCFDKTGTLTHGRPTLYEVHPVAWSDGKELLAIAAGMEADSTHPIAVAVREAAEQRGVTPATIDKLNHVVARGIQGEYAGARVRLGSFAFTEPVIPVCFRNRVKEVLGRIQSRGHVGVVIARAAAGEATPDTSDDSSGEAAVLIMADSVRPGATELVADLHALGVKPVRMLTGDNAITAKRIGESLGLDQVDAELLPDDKLRIVGEMKRATGPAGGVAFIGDGVNDAPALAAADVALAIGTIGTAAALENADAVLLADDLSTFPWAIRLARRARWTVTANVTFALSVIVIMSATTLVSSLMGREIPLSVGVLAHEGGTVLVVLNSLRILGFMGKRSKTPSETKHFPQIVVPERA
jgi:Cd2+/Zn2+-exporting ATPase